MAATTIKAHGCMVAEIDMQIANLTAITYEAPEVAA